MFVVAAVVLIVSVQRLNVPELVELRGVIGRGFQQRSVIAHNVRVIAATEAIAQAADGAAVVEALDLAFDGSEFHRMELCVPPGMSAPLVASGSRLVVAEGGGTLLRRQFADGVPGAEIEVRSVLHGDDGCVGRFSLYKSVDGDRLFTDLRLLPKRMVPVLSATLLRLSNEYESRTTKEDLERTVSVG